MSGSNQVAVSSGVSADVPIELRLNAVRESVNVSADAESPLSMDSSADSTINRTTVVNAPNKYDRADVVLPLIPGVGRDP